MTVLYKTALDIHVHLHVEVVISSAATNFQRTTNHLLLSLSHDHGDDKIPNICPRKKERDMKSS